MHGSVVHFEICLSYSLSRYVCNMYLSRYVNSCSMHMMVLFVMALLIALMTPYSFGSKEKQVVCCKNLFSDQTFNISDSLQYYSVLLSLHYQIFWWKRYPNSFPPLTFTFIQPAKIGKWKCCDWVDQIIYKAISLLMSRNIYVSSM